MPTSRLALAAQLRDLWTHTRTALEGNALTLGETSFDLGEAVVGVTGWNGGFWDQVTGGAFYSETGYGQGAFIQFKSPIKAWGISFINDQPWVVGGIR